MKNLRSFYLIAITKVRPQNYMNDLKNFYADPTTICNERVTPSMRWQNFLFCILLAILTIGIYWQTWNHDFIILDDNLYVTENVNVQKGLVWESVIWAFTSFHAGNWHPLTWLSHMADVELFGMYPRGHHLTSVIIHAASACLLYLFLIECTTRPWRSFFVAALFALHPLHVESVAWIAERKDVLYCFFWLLTLLFYSGYVKKPVLSRYLLTLLSFGLALMAKPMAVTLPLVLLLMDYWPCTSFHQEPGDGSFCTVITKRAPLSLLLKDKIPFLFLSVFAAIIAIYAQQKWSYVVPFDSLPFGYRVENALAAYASYMGKMVWPYGLAIIYPYSRALPLWQVGGSLMLLAGTSVLAYRFRKRLPYLPIGWLWFLITLLPVIGLIQVGSQSMADRYTYIPVIGLFTMITWGVSDLVKGWRYGKWLLTVSATAILLVLSAATFRQISYWKDSGSLFEHALEVTNGNYIAHNNLGMHLRRQGRNQEALYHFLQSVDISPSYSTGHFNLGVTFDALGNKNAAIRHLQTALLIDPTDQEARLYLEYLAEVEH